MQVTVRKYEPADLPAMIKIWNEIVEGGEAFPQEEALSGAAGADFFASQSYSAVAADERGVVRGLYILHPNNVGRCGHICNVSYAVAGDARGMHIGEALVRDCLMQAKEHGFRVLQFNAVVASNAPARQLYEHLGFRQLGTIPGGFRMKDGRYEDICPYYFDLISFP